MLVETKRLPIENEYVQSENIIEITDQDVNKLNERITKRIRENESIRVKGLEIAGKCRMR